MKAIDKLKITNECAKKAATWNKRIKKLKKSEQQFCADHGITHTHFNRNKNGYKIPTPEMVEKVEDALRSEGV